MWSAYVARVLAFLAMALAAVGCKSKVLSDAEAYEREACACKRGDLACARDKQDNLRPLLDAPVAWNESAPHPEAIERHREAGAACLRNVWSCSDDEPCPSGYFCGTAVADRGRFCARILAVGDPCGDIGTSECGPGLRCRFDAALDWMDLQPCGIAGCGPRGRCVAASASPAPAPAASASAAP
jgi:hypothetical protein